MEAEGDVVFVHKGLDAENMVDMGVGVDDALGLQLLVGNIGDELGYFVGAVHAGVYDPALFLVVYDDVGVLFEGVEGKKDDI